MPPKFAPVARANRERHIGRVTSKQQDIAYRKPVRNRRGPATVSAAKQERGSLLASTLTLNATGTHRFREGGQETPTSQETGLVLARTEPLEGGARGS